MFQGSIVAIITPWKDGALDKDKFADLIEFQIENGTSAIVPCGTTGESATMSHAEHIEVIDFTVKLVRNRVPVIAGTGSNATQEAIELTQKAKELGADASLSISPYYNKPTQEGIYQHFKKIVEETAFPCVVYNCPGRTGSSVAADTVARLSELDNIVALKDAEGDVDYTSAVLSKCDISVLSGNDSLTFPIMAMGGKGGISVIANIAPRANADMCDAMLDGDIEKARKLHLQYFKLNKALFVESNPIPIKAACEMMGLCGPEIRMPLVPITDGAKATLKAAMQEVGLL